MAVIDLAETAERETVFPFHGITSRLPETENEVAHEEHAEQDEQNFPDVFQCFHVFGILVNDFLLCCGCFFVFSIDFFGSLVYTIDEVANQSAFAEWMSAMHLHWLTDPHLLGG